MYREDLEQSSGLYVDRQGPKQTSEHMWTTKAQNTLRNICRQRWPRTDLRTDVGNEGPEQTSEHMWTTKNKLRNICGRRRSGPDFKTYVDNEGAEKTTETAQKRFQNICGQRRPRTDFGNTWRTMI